MSLYNPDESVPCAVCGENDFLPYRCSHCSKFYCKKHLSNHPPCDKLSNRQLTDEERAKMKQGVTLDQLFEAAMNSQKSNNSNANTIHVASSGAAASTTSTTNNRFVSSSSTLGSSLLPGFHRHKRLDLQKFAAEWDTTNSGLLRDVTTCVVYFGFLISSSSSSAVSRRERTNDDEDENDNQQKTTTTTTNKDDRTILLLRPLWIDTSAATTIASFFEKITLVLTKKYLPESIQGYQQQQSNNAKKLSWNCDLKTGQFSPFDTVTKEKKILEMLTNNNNNNNNTTLFSIEPKVYGKSMTGGCNVTEINDKNEKVGSGARCFVALFSEQQEQEQQQKTKSPLHEQLEEIFTGTSNSLWRKHSLGMLPFADPAAMKVPNNNTNNNNADPAQQRSVDDVVNQKTTEESSKPKIMTSNDDNDDHDEQNISSSSTGTKLVEVKWAPNVTRTNPISIGVYSQNTTSHSATPPNQILLTVGFFIDDETGGVAKNSFGFTLKLNSSWITGRIIDEIYGNATIKSKFTPFPSEKFEDGKNVQIMKLSTGEVLDDSVPIGKYFTTTTAFVGAPPTDGIAFCPRGMKRSLQSHLIEEVKDYGALVASKKMPKPLMVRSMKECVIQ